MIDRQNWKLIVICAGFLWTIAVSAALAGSSRMTYELPPSIDTGLAAGTQSSDGIGSNSVVDIVDDGTFIWAGTDLGVSRTDDNGANWTTYRIEDGLNANEVPAVAWHDWTERLWVATSRSIVADQQFVPVGTGFNLTTDHGATWQSFRPFQSTAVGMICYDLDFWGETIWGACFYGGLIRSMDGGQTWTNVLADRLDSLDFYDSTFSRLTNRYFAVAIDTNFTDSTVVWAGSAAGIHRYTYLDASLKITGTAFNELLYAGGFLWAAHNEGLSRTADAGSSWRTTNSSNGLLTNYVGAIYRNPAGTRLWVATDSVPGLVGSGLATTILGIGGQTGKTWISSAPAQVVGAGRRISSFARAGTAIWAAANNGALIRSFDETGQIWENYFIDGTLADDFTNNDPPLQPYNRVHSLLAISDADTTWLYVGTDDDLLRLVIPEDETTIDPVRVDTIDIPDPIIGEEVVALSDRVRDLRQQNLPGDETVIWALLENDGRGESGIATSSDGGQTWKRIVSDNVVHDVRFEPDMDSVYYMATDFGLATGTVPIGNPVVFNEDLIKAFIPNADDNDTLAVRTIFFDEDNRLWAGTDSGLAVSSDLGTNWRAIQTNPDPFQFDSHDRTTVTAGDNITGDFVVSLGVQHYGSNRTVWAGTRISSSGGTNGISYSSDLGETWEQAVTRVICNNFAFSNDTVFAACDVGLLRSPDQGASWDTLRNFADGAALIDSNVEVFSVSRIGDDLWIGTEDGVAVSDDDGESWRIIRRFVPTGESEQTEEGGAYASPVPYSPLSSPGKIRFHYMPPVTGSVTITIYDFSNRKVRVIANGVERTQGVQYDNVDEWNGRDEDGDIVAVGTYAFVIEYSNGDLHWGKCAIIP